MDKKQHCVICYNLEFVSFGERTHPKEILDILLTCKKNPNIRYPNSHFQIPFRSHHHVDLSEVVWIFSKVSLLLKKKNSLKRGKLIICLSAFIFFPPPSPFSVCVHKFKGESYLFIFIFVASSSNYMNLKQNCNNYFCFLFEV